MHRRASARVSHRTAPRPGSASTSTTVRSSTSSPSPVICALSLRARDLHRGRRRSATSRTHRHLRRRLHGLDSELRELCESLGRSCDRRATLEFTLEAEAKALTSQTAGIRADVAISGRMDGLSASQRIALVRFVQEALNNVREHSGATHGQVTLGAARPHECVRLGQWRWILGRADAPPRRESRSFRLGRHERTGTPPSAAALTSEANRAAGRPSRSRCFPWQPSVEQAGFAEPSVAG